MLYGQQNSNFENLKSSIKRPNLSLKVDNIINVTDFNAFPNDNKNDWKGISEALNACEKKRGKVQLFFPKGTYNIKLNSITPNTTHAFELKNINNLIIEGDSAIIIIENPEIGFMSLNNINNGIIKGFTIDYKTLPFAQGEITNLNTDNNSFFFEIDNIGGSPCDENFKNSKTKWGVLFDKNNNRILKDKAPNLIPIKEISHTDKNNLFCITTTKNVINQIAENDPFAIIARYNGRPTYSINHCQRITFTDNIQYSGPAGSFGIRESAAIGIINCQIKQKSDRLISQNADCIHVTPGYEGPWIENCLFEGQMDDAINIKTELVYILRRISDNEFIVSNKLKKGDKLSLFNPRKGILIGTCNIIESNKNHIKIDKVFPPLEIGKGKDKDMFFNDSKSNRNFVIKNNIFRNSRRYGMLIQAKDGIIEGNKFENISTGGITLQNSASWPEGFVPQNIIIQNNILKNTGFDKSYWMEGYAASPIILRTTTFNKKQAKWQGVRNIQIKNNKIISNSDNAIYISGAENIYIENNECITIGASPYYQENCKNIIIK